jgi:hypothetical protein
MEDSMRTVMVTYKTHPQHAEANQAFISAVFAELRERQPAGLSYATYRLPDGVSFLHLATLANADQNPLLELASFKAFLTGIKERCVEPPTTTTLSPIAAYEGRMS